MLWLINGGKPKFNYTMTPKEIAERTIKSVMKYGETDHAGFLVNCIMYDLADRRMLRDIDEECISEIKCVMRELIEIIVLNDIL